MIDVRLKAFVSVAQNLSFSAAARELYISQPAVSRHVRELESEYGVRLFERAGSKVRLTPAGEVLLGCARDVLDSYRRLGAAMDSVTGSEHGDLRIGASTTIAQYVLPEVVAVYRRQRPGVRLSLVSGNSREIESQLFQGRIDLALVEGIHRQSGISYAPFMKDELVVIARADGVVADSISVDSFRRMPVVLREPGSGTLDVVRQALAAVGVAVTDLNVEMNIGSTEGIKLYVRNSDALGIVSVRSVSADVYRNVFRIVDVEGLSMERSFMFAEREGESSGAVLAFKEFLISYCNS